jgi:predicted 3-demethylubiquinone-9 3-methyltransferase (glyoxalase superfamily)
MAIKQRITNCLWFDGQAEEAANFYVAIFKNSKTTAVSRYGEAGPGPKGSVMTVAFELDGQTFVGLNGGPTFKFTEAISMIVNCDTQAEVDFYWEKLTEGGGKPGQCGWLKDKFGVSWQVVPSALPQLLTGADGAATDRVMNAVLKMKKFDLEALKRAHAGQG